MPPTPHHRHPPIPMRILPKEGFWERADVRVGDAYWTSDAAGRRSLWIMIPQMRADLAHTPVARQRGVISEWTIGHRNHCGAEWGWDGDELRPTLTPSLHAVGVWHGWVTAGQLIEA